MDDGSPLRQNQTMQPDSRGFLRKRAPSIEGPLDAEDLSTHLKIRVGFGLALGCLGVVGIVSYLAVARLGDEAVWVDYTLKVIDRLDSLVPEIIDAQNGYRGFVVTGDEAYLESYFAAVRNGPAGIQQLRRLTADNAEQQRRLDRIEPQLDSAIAYGRAVIDARRNQGFEAAKALVVTGRGKLLYDQIRAMVGSMRNAEQELLVEREARAARGAVLAQVVIVSGSAVAFAFSGLALFAIRRDFARRRRAEQALGRSEEKYRSLFNSSHDAIVTMEPPSWNLSDGNPVAVNMFGARDSQEFLSLKVWEQSPERQADGRLSAEKAVEMMGAAMREGYRSFEWTFKTADGELFFADVRLVRTEVGGKLILQATVRDITEHKLAERQLREQNEILSRSTEGMMIVSLANRISLWNLGAELIFGWKAAEALGRQPEELLGLRNPEDLSALRATIDREGHWNGELPMRTRDGREIIVDCRITLVKDEAGRPRARLNFLADITEKKKIGEQLLHLQRLESIGMLAAGIAHDLNNVLAPIMFVAPMLRDSLSSPRDLKILDTLEQCATRGAGLVKQILGFVHKTSGEFHPTQVKHLAMDIISVIEQTFPKSIQVRSQIPAELWLVLGDATQLHQVLLNLCVNARDAMPQGGTLRIDAANRRLDAAEAGAIPGAQPGVYVMLEVADTGTGIPREIVNDIWTPFFTTKGAGKGTGLGLSTIRGIVIGHRGFIQLDTEVGRGTTFRVFLPAVEQESPAPGDAPPEAPLGNGELILVVDDDPSIRNLIAAILEGHGYRAVRCADGVEAIAAFNARLGSFSLVITDVDMPQLGGTALARALLRIRPDIRLLAISGLARGTSEGVGLPSIRDIAHGFLLKPFNAEDLLATVHGVLHPAQEP